MSANVTKAFNAAAIVAALVRAIDLDPSLCDVYEGEASLPPVVLKAKDLKPWYNVQTPQEGWVYFSYMVENSDMDTILAKLREKACQAMEELLAHQDEQLRSYAALSGTPYKKIDKKGSVYLFSDIIALGKAQGIDVEAIFKEVSAWGSKNGIDIREISMEVVRTLAKKLSLPRPSVVLFLAPPYVPHNTLLSPMKRRLLTTYLLFCASWRKKRAKPLSCSIFSPALATAAT